ncbi:MAG: SufD family Fe-S cluster assembly protein, partial [Hyphomicrobiales bacterium]|nr:SufD family Fe-S cluster assembly protein [Hyphomicrobiales bacterium]
MSLERVIAKTAAETALAVQFAALRAAAPCVQREAAFRRFEQSGLPTRRVESWHYTDLRAALVNAPAIAAGPSPASLDAARGALASLARVGATRIVLVDGHYVAALSDSPAAGVAVSADAPAAPTLGEADPVLALNVALAQGGCALAVAAGAKAPLIEIVHYLSPAAQAVYSRLAISLGAGAEASLVERFIGAGAAAQRNVSTWIDVAKDAKASHVVSIEDEAGLHIESQVANLAEGAALDAFALVAGGALARRQIFATLAGERGRIGLGGLSLIDGRRHADTTLEVVHAAPNGESREFYRHIVA